MANIENELNAILLAVLGEEVRTSIHDGIQKINNTTEHAINEMIDYNTQLEQALSKFKVDADDQLSRFDYMSTQSLNSFNTFMDSLENKVDQMLINKSLDIDNALRGKELEFDAWFTTLSTMLEPDIAAHLAEQLLKTQTLIDSNRRMMFRGKNLGTSVTSEQAQAIKDGTFTDMYVGDYWYQNSYGRAWRIWDFNYWPKTYIGNSTTETKLNHVVIIPERTIINRPINENRPFTGGYQYSDLVKTGLDVCLTHFESFFGGIGTYAWREELRSNSAFTGTNGNGAPISVDRVRTPCDIMDTMMLTGAPLYHHANVGYELVGTSTVEYEGLQKQLALSIVAPQFRNAFGSSYWLKDPTTVNRYAAWDGPQGRVISRSVSDSIGVRPTFAFCGRI